jgi:hypothetical protein
MQEAKFKKQYVMFDLEVLSNDIWYWDNVISYPDDLVRLIEDLDQDPESYNNIPKWTEWTASDDKSLLYGYVKMIQSDTIKNKSTNPKINQKVLYVVNTLKMAAEMSYNQYINQHTNIDPAKYQLDLSHVPVKRWNINSYMGPHSDGGYGHPNLSFTTVTYLNDNYEGGEINFPNDNITIKPKAGSLIMFPASTVHEVKPVLNGVRYTSTNSINMI